MAWPTDWWPRHPPEPKVYLKDVGKLGTYALPHPPAALDKPPPDVKFSCTRATSDWIQSLGGVPDKITVDFALTTERTESVFVIGLTPHVREVKTPPMRTTVVDCIPPSGVEPGAVPEISANLVVDARPPRFDLFDETGRSIERLALNLKQGDAADFHLTVHASSPGAVYAWTVDLELLVGGEPRRISISDGGKPFRIAGPLPGTAPRVDLTAKLESGD